MMRTILIILSLFVVAATSSAQTWQELMDSTKSYMDKQDYQTALQWAEKAEVIAKMEYGEKDTNYIASLTLNYLCHYYIGNTEEAINYCENAKQLIKQIRGEKCSEYLEVVGNLGVFYKKKGLIEETEKLYKEALEINRSIYKGDHANFAESINKIANYYEERGQFAKAEPLFKEALEMRRRLFKSDNPDLAKSINNMAYCYEDLGRYAEAEQLYLESLEMRRRLFKSDNPDLAQSINNLASFYNGRGRYAEAEQFYKEALEINRRLYISYNPMLAITINNLAFFYQGRGRYKESEPLFKESLEMRRGLFKGDNPELATSINNLAHFYNEMGLYTEAEPLYKEALEMRRRIYKKDHPNLAISIKNMATFYNSIGCYSKAEILYKEALEMSRRLFNGDNQTLATSINGMAYFYEGRGRHLESEPLFKEALEMRKRLFKGDDHPNVANSINNMAMFYYDRKHYDDAESLFIEALSMRRRIFKGDHPELAQSINNMAFFYKGRERYSEAEPLFIEALEMNKRLFKGNHPDLALSLDNMAQFFELQGLYPQAESLFIESLEMNRRLFKEDHPVLAQTINNIAHFYECLGRYGDAEVLYYELITVCNNMMNNYFPSLSENEKEQYYNTFSKYYHQFNNFAVSKSEEFPQLVETIFDNQLLTKGMLLNTSNKVRNRIILSQDTNLILLFNRWKDKKEYIAKLYQLSKAQLENKNIHLDTIIKSANEQEKELTKHSEFLKKEFDKQKLTWKNIQNSIEKEDAAVEIVRFKYFDMNRIKDSAYYAALILKSNSTHPELVLLKNGNELESNYIFNYKNLILNKLEDKDSYVQFWEPIEKKLKGIKRVYISPDGVYNQINLATLMNPKTERYLSDILDIRVVTSTRDLVERKETPLNPPLKNGAEIIPHSPPLEKGEMIVELFGDPMFNLDSTKHLELASAISENRTREFYYLGNTLDSTTRGGIRPLPSTRTEIEQIANEFTKKGWKVNSHLGEKALEEAVKGVDNPKVLHIATHGKFLKDVEVKDDDRMLGMETKRVAENPLLRSFLLFSGAENTLNDQKLENQNTDDGLLTAYEAMNLNLDKTDLVVLSACETGLGEIKNGEGVYGLQRAFQQAGAKSIIMSLWTVPDKETQELMTSFYSKWLNGKDKRTAFNEARNDMRDKYHYPYYWGGFVMVGE